MLNKKIIEKIKLRLHAIFPLHPHIYFGRRTGTLLFRALSNEDRTNVILPGFICPNLSAMVQHAGKTPVHIDIDPTTLQMKMNLLGDYLEHHPASATCLMVDHSFGYVSPDVKTIRGMHSKLLIIEDCARAFGGYHNQSPAGSLGDWILLSMYKTVRGNEHGGILLSREPLSCEDAFPKAYSSPREYLSKITALRFIYERIKRRNAPLGSEPVVQESLSFTPEPGMPSLLVLCRFLTELRACQNLAKKRDEAWGHLRYELSRNRKVELIKVREQTTPSKYFLSFMIHGIPNLHILLQRLNQAGYFLFNAWPDTPNNFRCFEKTFPHGYESTAHLARNIVHIPIADFLKEKHRSRFLIFFEELLVELQEKEA